MLRNTEKNYFTFPEVNNYFSFVFCLLVIYLETYKEWNTLSVQQVMHLSVKNFCWNIPF